MPATVWECLDTWAREAPDRAAVWVSGSALTFAELREAAALLGTELLRRGARRGDRIAVWCPMSLASLVTLFACAYARTVFAPINTRLTFREAHPILARLEPRALVIGTTSTSTDPITGTQGWVASCREQGQELPRLWVEESAAALDGATAIAPILRGARDAVAAQRRSAAPSSTPAPDDSFLVQMTSGSTAAPKAVLLGQGQCIRMGFELAKRFDIHAGDRYFVCNPIHHVGSTNFGLLTAHSDGAGFYTLREFNAEDAIAAIRTNACTHHHGIEAHYLYELRSPALKGGLPTVRVVSAHGDMAQRVMNAFGPVVNISVYGSSETTASPFATDHTDPLERRLTSDGHPLPGVEARIVDPDTGAPLPPGRVGELQIRGWCVMQGYFRDAAATAASIDANGWYHTGDMASMDEDSNLRFFARMKDFLRVGGENVAAAEIEAVLQSHAAVRLAVVVPFPHEVLGQVPVAFVVDEDAVPPAPADQLVAHCAEHLAGFKVPRQIHKVTLDDLPMTGPGKVKKAALEERAMELARSRSTAPRD